MKLRKPDYYSDFECIADKCPQTCCSGWGIVIDEKSMKRYQELPKAQRDYVLSHIDQQEGMFRQCGARCSFLNEKNLCDLYISVGEEYFCDTCRRYPRHFEEYGNLIEASLSLSCPVAAEMILGKEGSDVYLIREKESPKCVNFEVDDFLLQQLLQVRKHIFAVIKNRRLEIRDRMTEILQICQKVQPSVYAYEKAGMKRYLPGERRKLRDEVSNICSQCAMGKYTHVERNLEGGVEETGSHGNKEIELCKLEERYHAMPEYFDMLLGFESINADWPQMVQNVQETLYHNITVDQYCRYVEQFQKAMESRRMEYEHLLSYFIYTYFLGSVYDYNLEAMGKLSVFSTLILREMGLAEFIRHDGVFDFEMQKNLCIAYARQMEHSDENILALEGILNVHPKFATDILLKIL